MNQTDGLANDYGTPEAGVRDTNEPELDPGMLDEFLKNPDAFVAQSNSAIRSVEDLQASLCYAGSTAPELADIGRQSSLSNGIRESTTTCAEPTRANEAIAATPIATIPRGSGLLDLERPPYSIREDEHGAFARVPLTQDRFTLCDVEDADFMSKEKPVFYCASGGTAWCYARLRSHQFAHRAIALRLGADPTRDFVVDHVNGVGLDNRRRNLRVVYVPNPTNTLNRIFRSDSRIPLSGVFPSGAGWVARIVDRGISYEETFQRGMDAALARDARARELGLAVRFNDPLELRRALGSLALTFPQGTEDILLLQHRRDTARTRRKPYIDETLGCAVVPLSDGSVAYCDRADIDLVARYSWWPQRDEHGKTVSVCAKIGKKTSMANYLMEMNRRGLAEGKVWDHKHRRPLDNRKDQLRGATRKQNAENRSKPRNGNTPLHRVCQLKSGRYQITLGSGRSRRVLRTWKLAYAALLSDALLRDDPERQSPLNFPEFEVPLERLMQLPSARRKTGRRLGNENGFLGVRRLRCGMYEAYLSGVIDGVANRWFTVGIFDTDVAAARARDAAACTRLFCRRLRLNFPPGVPEAIYEFLRLTPLQVFARLEESQARAASLLFRPCVTTEKLRASLAQLDAMRPPKAL
jgi:hypothetical protein